ncbi:hypothetical protein R3P38DRAFT_2846906 [Favolaschia claudopus]|uniref:Uncharacterized protein n=1 Tax=Favolaschia claudopus TaxID=2862362 RepID=A0AAW0DVK4_9AGAR
MPTLMNTTNFDHHARRLDVDYHNMAASSSCQPSPSSPQFYNEGRRGSFDEDDEEDEGARAKQRECVQRVAAWINQSAVRITATISTSYIPPNASFDMPDFDLDLEDESELDILDSDIRYVPEGEPYLLYSSSCKSVGRPVIHAPSPRRSSRSRGRRHHNHPLRRPPSPLYVIQEEDSE